MSNNKNQNDFPLYLFYQGKNYEAYKFFGVHSGKKGRSKIFTFRVWAPTAVSVSVVGDFNNWDRSCNPMTRIADGVWEAQISKLKQFDAYKYSIETADGRILMKADPYAAHFETRPGTASKIYESSYDWEDSEWYEEKKSRIIYKSPVNIYEVHLGSWKNYGEEKFLDYITFANEIIPYLKKMSYTHVEFMPLTEYPFDGSWGYQVTGYFAPTSRYGTPDDLRKMIDMFHKAGIGVILDWVPGHFCRDAHGLGRFDGTALYESGDMPGWGTYKFNYARNEVRSFLISSALFWLEEYHADALRVDGVSSLLYLNFGVDDPARKKYNERGGEEDLAAVAFLQTLNTVIGKRVPGAATYAEESSAWPLVTYPPEKGGLGFHYKWDMGWMNDTLRYMSIDFDGRKYNHGLLTFSMMYAFSENYILPLSHDEVVHGKKSMLDKMYGDYDQKFASLRALYGFQFAHPGKKLCFMGGEFGQFIEWNWQQELDWLLLAYPRHEQLRDYYRKLNKLYAATPAMYRVDKSWDGFRWLNVDDRDRSSVAFLRSSEKDESYLVCVCNFTPVRYDDFVIALPVAGTLHEVLNSDDERFGGGGVANPRTIKTEKEPFLDMQYSAKLTLPPMASVMFSFKPRRKKNEKRIS